MSTGIMTDKEYALLRIEAARDEVHEAMKSIHVTSPVLFELLGSARSYLNKAILRAKREIEKS